MAVAHAECGQSITIDDEVRMGRARPVIGDTVDAVERSPDSAAVTFRPVVPLSAEAL